MLFIEFTNDFTEIKKKVAKLGGHPVVTIEKEITKSISFRTEKEVEKVNFKVVVSVGNIKLVHGCYPAYYEALWVSQNLEFELNR